jgi:glycosyltransferase involved in cell wall biosynthesis
VHDHVGRKAAVIPNIWPGDIAVRGTTDSGTALWVSNVRPEKRPEMMLEIAEALPAVQFTMIGGPVSGHEQQFESVRSRAEALSNVEFLGYVPFEETRPHFERASILVNTSAVEGFPNTYLQAWAAGKPVVATFDPDGVIARHGLGSTFSEVHEALGQIRELWEDRDRVSSIGERATEYMRKHHGEAVVGERVEGLLAEL